MPDQKPAFSYVSASLLVEVRALPALTEPSDSDLPAAMLALISAIDRVDIAYQASRAAGLVPGVSPMTIAEYLTTQREIKGLCVADVALRLQTDPALPFADRVEWIKSIEAGVAPISIANATAYLAAVRLNVPEAGLLLDLIRDQEQRQSSVCPA